MYVLYHLAIKGKFVDNRHKQMLPLNEALQKQAKENITISCSVSVLPKVNTDSVVNTYCSYLHAVITSGKLYITTIAAFVFAF